jgi:hypothetical protein
MAVHGHDPDQVFYASWDVRKFRSVEQYADYRRVKSRLRRPLVCTALASTPKVAELGWRSFVSDAGTIALVLLTAAMLIAMLFS